MTKQASLKIDYIPHTGQTEVLNGIMKSQADVIIIVGARGWGKTLFIGGSIVVPPMIKYSHFQVCWIAPNYKIARAPIDDFFFGVNENTNERYINNVCPNTGFTFFEHKKGDNELHFWNNSKMFLRSADAPNTIVSKGYNLIVIDEGALIPKDVFELQILPIARKKNCKIVIITSPRGKNWVYHLYLDGQDPAKKEYYSIRQPWWKRPDYPPLLKKLMLNIPKHIKAQEFDAEFIDGGGGCFTNLEKIFRGQQITFPTETQEWTHPQYKSLIANHDLVMGIDFAKNVDYTVIAVLNSKKQLIYYSRMNKVDYKVVLEKIKSLAKKFNQPEVIYDATGVGQAISDFMSTELNVFPFVFTNSSKSEIVNRLILDCEFANLDLPNILTIKNEFEIFEFNLTKTGKISYSAPDGKHDDTVMAIAMANWYLEENGMKSEVGEIDNFLEVIQEKKYSSIFDAIEDDND